MIVSKILVVIIYYIETPVAKSKKKNVKISSDFLLIDDDKNTFIAPSTMLVLTRRGLIGDCNYKVGACWQCGSTCKRCKCSCERESKD